LLGWCPSNALLGLEWLLRLLLVLALVPWLLLAFLLLVLLGEGLEGLLGLVLHRLSWLSLLLLSSILVLLELLGLLDGYGRDREQEGREADHLVGEHPSWSVDPLR